MPQLRRKEIESAIFDALNLANDLAKDLPIIIQSAVLIGNNLFSGQHNSKNAGFGDEFWQYRAIANGESAKSIDWRKSAKSTQTFTKEHEKRNPKNYQIWCDLRPEMFFSGNGLPPQKAHIGLIFALAFAQAFINSNENVKVLGQKTAISNIEKFASNLILEGKNPVKAFQKGNAIIISDGFENIETYNDLILKAQNAQCSLNFIFIKDSFEANFEFTNRILFATSKSDKSPILIENCEDAKKGFIENYDNHFDKLKILMQNENIGFFISGNHKAFIDDFLKFGASLMEAINENLD